MHLNKKKIVVTGGTGRFAYELKKVKNKYKVLYPSKSVLDILKTISSNLSKTGEFVDKGRNEGDPSKVWANNSRFKSIFEWKPNWTITFLPIKAYRQFILFK